MTSGFSLRRTLLFIHRWLGVALCALFLIWFPSGIAMMYWGFPEVTPLDRLARGSDLDPATINVSPTDVFAARGLDGPPLDIRISTYAGRPVYRFTDSEGESVVFADTGEFVEDVSGLLMLRVAAGWTGLPAEEASVSRIDEPDQWTLQIPFRRLQPLWKHSWPGGDEVYVSAVTGEVVQATTRASRLGAYLGPIPHWFYFTPLRTHAAQWSRVVIWTSGLGTLTAIVGMVIGVWAYLPRRRVPYQGQKRWHLILGLLFGVGAVTWAFSGLLSMDPFPALDERSSTAADLVQMDTALRAAPSMEAIFAKPPQAALAEIAHLGVRQLVVTMVGGEAGYLATLADGQTRVVPVDGPVATEFDRQTLRDLVVRATAPVGGVDVTLVDAYDAYYLDRNGDLPLPVMLAQLRDPDRTRYYIDPKTARVVSTYSSRRWVDRWLYHGLHSLQLPWLYTARPVWDIVVIVFMLGGTALAFTSVVLAWRVVGRTLRIGSLSR